MRYLAPSILSADLLKLEYQIKILEENGADFIHVDVMDGRFVPNITFGPAIVKTIKRVSNLPLDVHLMIEDPQNYIKDFAEAGADYITLHQEACRHLDRCVTMVRENGCKAGVSINPATPVQMIEPVLGAIDLALIMSVNPGFGGQKFIPYTLEKIKALKKLKTDLKYSYLIEVDGGINSETIIAAREAGAEIFVAGNAVFNASSIAKAVKELKQLIRDDRD